ncbi:altronate dehydratase [Alicyclobacillus curvatus]|nr:altronate dehydratase [Alicyclobacillus curvatus]
MPTTYETTTVLELHCDDNVGVALADLMPGDVIKVRGGEITVTDTIPTGHKMALTDIAQGQNVVKYGYPIGHVVTPVVRGGWVHSHNLKTNLSGKLDYEYRPSVEAAALATTPTTSDSALSTEFLGYVRDNGDVGIRNDIWIINTVGCINKVAERLADMANKQFQGDGIDGVFSFAHPYGCSQLGDDLKQTQKALAGLVRHPNAAGVLVLGLGCENNRIGDFSQVVGDVFDKRVKYLAVQGVEDEFEAGLELIHQLVDYARTFKRELVPVSKLKIGLKCGGSDGFSGITANPLVGAVSDLVVAGGGTALLTEVPEMFGAESILMNRAKDEATFHKVVHLIDDFKDYYTRHNQVIYENPSPGNKDGGITTLEEKSLGCTQKGGLSTVVDVLPYAEPAQERGLNLVQAPGNDMVSVTALIAGGAHVVLFTTGRGTPLGGVVPTLKISTNTALYERKRRWIDLDAGRLLSGTPMQALARELYEMVVDVASGKVYAHNEQNGFREIAIFKDGVTL